jgi:hypothetical protein
MGASGWSYRTPYQPDVEAALHALREEVFARGEYLKPWEMMGIPYAEMRAMSDEAYAEFEDEEPQILRPFGTTAPPEDAGAEDADGPRTIDELLRTNAESGTHSILDIIGIADEPAFGAACPVPDEILMKCFGTTQPTVEQVGQGWANYPKRLARLVEDLERWHAVYFVIYKDGAPHEIAFDGVSGD